MITKYSNKDILEFLVESNSIENIYDNLSLAEAHEAWQYAFKHRRKITLEVILQIHNLLCGRQFKSKGEKAGRVRNVVVRVGRDIKKFVSVQLIEEELKQWILSCKLDKKGVPKHQWEAEIRKWHVAFERIHPFLDGNGRVGRILYNIHRFNNKLPIHIIHEGDEQELYYEWFNTNA